MKFQFKRGKHTARPPYWLRWFPFLHNIEKVERRVLFTADSKYDLKSSDQHLNNFLFGIGFPRNNSARFGWRFEPSINKFILSAVCRRRGDLFTEDLCEVVANHTYKLGIYLLQNEYVFSIINDSAIVVTATAIDKNHKMKSGWLLGPRFGGRPAPHWLFIDLKK